MLSAEQIIGRVDRLPSLPAAYFRVCALVNDPQATLQQVVDVIEADPPMAARTLAVVNSVFYALPHRVETIRRALSYLGMRQVYDIALATSLARTFHGIRPEQLNMTRFWRGSVYRGIAARQLARACGLLDAERLFVEGLLSDIGHLAMYLAVPALALAAREAAQSGAEVLAATEQRLIGCNYAQVGAALLARWQLPEAIEQTVRYHVEPQEAGKRELEAAVVFVAAHLAGAALDELPLPVGAEIPATVWPLLKVSDGVLPAVIKAADGEAAAVTALFFPELRSAA